MAVFDHQDLLCCSCLCKCGSYADQRVSCVHVPAVGVLFPHLLMDGLAEHNLVEISLSWAQSFLSFEEDKQQQLFNDMALLLTVENATKFGNCEQNLLMKIYQQCYRTSKLGHRRRNNNQNHYRLTISLNPLFIANNFTTNECNRKNYEENSSCKIESKKGQLYQKSQQATNELQNYYKIAAYIDMLEEIDCCLCIFFTKMEDSYNNIKTTTGHRLLKNRCVLFENKEKETNHFKEKIKPEEIKNELVQKLGINVQRRYCCVNRGGKRGKDKYESK